MEDLNTPKGMFARHQSKRLSRLGPAAFLLVAGLILLNFLYSYTTEFYCLRPGIAQYRQGNYRTAERDLRLYLRLENDPAGHYYLGRTLLAEGKEEAAYAQFDQDRILVPVGGKNYEWRLDRGSAVFLNPSRQIP